jgi:hypothetical protein
MNRLATIFGILAAGLMVGVLPAAVANATPAADPGNQTHSPMPSPRDPHGMAVASATAAVNSDRHRIPMLPPQQDPSRIDCPPDPDSGPCTGEVSVAPLTNMERLMGVYSQRSAESVAVISGTQSSVSQMAKNVKQ